MEAKVAPSGQNDDLLGVLQRALRMVWQASPRLASAQLLVITAQATLPLLLLYLTKLIVDTITVAIGNPTQDMARHLLWLVCGAGAAALAYAVLSELALLISDTQKWVVSDKVNQLLHEKSIAVDVDFYEDPQHQNTFHRAQAEAAQRPTQVLTDLLRTVRGAMSLIGVMGLLWVFHWAFLVLLMLAALPAVFVRLKYDRIRFRLGFDWTPIERKAWYFQRVLVDKLFAKEVRLFNLGPHFIRRYRELREQLREEQWSIATRRCASMIVAELVGVVASYGSFAFVAYRALYGQLTIGDFVLFYQAFQRGRDCLHDLLDAVGNLHEHGLFLSSFYKFLDIPKRVTEPVRPRPVAQPIRHGISFDHVSFRYPSREDDVLHDLSLTIPAGKMVALVGKNGAGKTTLVKLLCRLYDPTSGAIFIDGVDLRQLATRSLQDMIAIVPQDYVPYCATVRENIWFGNVDLKPVDQRIGEAARLAGAEAFIQKLDRGYETSLGTAFDNGVDLSIGEWQKMAIARAFFRDAPILILDEPTSNLDAHAEHDVFQHFRKVARGRTTIVISHRLSIVRDADQICVLEHGKITEQGSHEELTQLGGAYARMFEVQANYYR
ncbi:MAG: ABC transporter ATP-binding protein [Methylovirgula sp.]